MTSRDARSYRKDLPQDNQTKIGKFIESRRKLLRKTQAQVAAELRRLGYPVSDAAVSHWESRTSPNIPKLTEEKFVVALAQVLQTTPYMLHKEAGTMNVAPPSSQREVSEFSLVGMDANRQEIENLLNMASIDELETIKKVIQGLIIVK